MLNINLNKAFNSDLRSIKVRKNVIASAFLKALDGVIYLLLVPITLNYLTAYEYGIWLTLNSLLMWINSFDIGLGNGLRNQLTKALAENNKVLARTYVSTTLYMLIIVVAVIIVLFWLCQSQLNWYVILGTTQGEIPNLNDIISFTFIICCFNFVLKIINTIYLAFELPAISNLINVLGHLLSLIVIFILTKFTSGNLLFVALAYTLSPLMVYIFAYPVTFTKVYSFLSPSVSFVKVTYAKTLLGVGIQFFILQISGILLFSITNLLILHMFGPDQVSAYNISYRYFSLVPMLMNLVLAPMWSATTNAFHTGDIGWIKRSIRDIRRCLYLVYLALGLMVIVSPLVYKLWIGTTMVIPLHMTSLMSVYIAILLTSMSYSTFLNGIGKLRIQTINTVCVAIIAVPLYYILGKFLGIYGVLVGLCLLNMSGLIFNIVQFNKLISFNASGIWAK